MARTAARSTTAAAPPSGRGGSVPNPMSGASAGLVIPDEDELDDETFGAIGAGSVGPDTLGATSADLASREADLAAREAAFAARTRGIPVETPDDVAVANSAKLGPSAVAMPVGMPKTVRIILEETANQEIPPTGLPVSLNGKAYIIRPGEEVSVPQGVAEILDNAIMHVPVTDPQTMKVIGHRKRLRFPYRKL